ncbi:MAG: hypothetical protein PHC28_06660 [Flavobacterium sp.]|uniref:hypothetical protein n=1 Tax=Flavobacterium sp. TaxID=239 RepID=UPI00261BC804|nr:hypothetical protein [Flavobacterium sp.]MDD5150152.1 hypothetical protein [Flavobacterium sp.]
MKKTILILVLLTSSLVYSQDVYEIIAKETCECLAQKKIDYASISKENLQKEVGICIINSYTSHSNDFKPEEKISFDDEEGMGKMGEAVALKMLNNCPETIFELGKSTINNTNDIDANPKFSIIEGEIIDVKIDQFASIILKDKNGRVYNFLILDYFETASLFTNNEINKKDIVSISFSESELYDPKMKEFRYFKIVSKIEKK